METQGLRLREYRAAGGIVVDDDGRMLVLERWVIRSGEPVFEVRLPKGHVEEGETDEEAALRETCEESGYCGVEVVADLGETITEWTNATERIRRNEHYYLLRLSDPVRVDPRPDSPDADEAHFRPRWLEGPAAAIHKLTFGSEKMFARRALEALASRNGGSAG